MSNTSSKLYETLDGKRFTAATSTELIEQLRQDSFAEAPDLISFMADVSKRCYEYRSCNIRIDTHDHFVEDLLQHEFLKIIPSTNTN